MKELKTAFVLAFSTAIVLAAAVGCSKQEETSSAPSEPAATTTTSSSISSNLSSAENAIRDQATAVQGAVSDATKKASEQAQTAAQQITGQAETLLTQAKSFVAEKKYQEALNTMKQLSGLSLTPEQEKVLRDLQKQIQSGLAAVGATNAASQLNSLLGGKK